MSPGERAQVGEHWFGLAAMYGKELNSMALKIMLDSVDDLSAIQILSALGEWAKTSKQNRHPVPAEVRQMVCPTVDDQTKALNITTLVLKAITVYGWAQPSESEKMMGPVGWELVRRYGGWGYVCENLGDTIDVTTFTAQLREGVKAELQISAAGRTGDSNLLDYNQPKQLFGMNQASEVLKTIMPKGAK